MGDDSLNSSNFFISSLEQFFPLEKVRPMLSFEKKKKKREGRTKIHQTNDKKQQRQH